MKPTAIVLLVGAAFAAIVYFLRPSKPTDSLLAERSAYTDYSTRSAKEEGWAPVQLWWEAPPEMKGEWRARKAARFTLTGGEVFVGDSHIPREKIKAFLDQRVASGEIDYVVLFPTKGTRWSEVFPALDECRKSRVRIVLLNQYES
jgi:hypothetical protein